MGRACRANRAPTPSPQLGGAQRSSWICLAHKGRMEPRLQIISMQTASKSHQCDDVSHSSPPLLLH